MKKKAIIIGATSGIGQEVAKILREHGYIIGITGRRINLLEKLKEETSSEVFIKSIDVTNAEAVNDLQCLINEMQGIDLIIICAGVGFIDPELPWNKEKETIKTNVIGFTAMANVAFHHFIQKKQGHLVGISSIAAIRGGGAPAYNASKAFVSNYLQGLRYVVSKSNNDITITDIQPGFVNTAMAQGEGLFWVASPKKAATQIYKGIKSKKKHVYITKRWRLIRWLLKVLPDALYHKI